MTFEQLGLIEPIRKALISEGYTQPTPIQEQAIPHLLAGRDVLGCAQTGTGKTAAFALPILQLLSAQPPTLKGGKKPIQALILTPTRELAIQIDESFRTYGQHTHLRHLVIFGGVSQHAQTQALKNGVDILVATPGRLLDLINQKFISLRDVTFFVLDEADRMLDMGFVHDVKKVLAMLPRQRQNLLFSATMPNDIVQLASSFLQSPVRVEVTPVSSTAETVVQTMYFVEKNAKRHLLQYLIEKNNISRLLVFTRTKHGADRVAKDLNRSGINAMAIHGNKSQNARQLALSEFKAGKLRVLVATDIAARGIDIDDLGYVLNFDLPNIPETYVHRIGRTGRAGNAGKSFSFADSDEKAYLKDIQKLIGRSIPVDDNHQWHASVSLPFTPSPSQRPPAQRPFSGRKGQGQQNRGPQQRRSQVQLPQKHDF